MSESTEVYRPKFYLIGPSSKFKLEKNSVLGRRKGDIIINDSKLSGEHCRFILRGLKVFIQDMNSSNGVYVNGSRIEPGSEKEIRPGDKIHLGAQEYVFSDKNNAVISFPEGPEIQGIFTSKNLLSFFGSGIGWQLTYWTYICGVLFLLIMTNLIVNFPPELKGLEKEFLSSVYKYHITFLAILVSFCWFHAYQSKFKIKGQLIKIMFGAGGMLCLFFVLIAVEILSPHNQIASYLAQRQAALEKLSKKEAVRLLSFQDRFSNLPPQYKKHPVLEADFRTIERKAKEASERSPANKTE